MHIERTQTHNSSFKIPPFSKASKFQTGFLAIVHYIPWPKRISIRSLFMGKDMWACTHPKTESFRMASPDVYKSVNSVYVDFDTFSEFSNWFESDSSAASTSEVSSLEDCGDMSELVVEGLMRGLCSERFFFQPDCTKSIVDDGEQEKGGNKSIIEYGEQEKRGRFLPFTKVGSGLHKGKDGGLSLFKENQKVVRGFEREITIDDEIFQFKENLNRVNASLKRETDGEVLAFTELLKQEKNDEERFMAIEETPFEECKMMLVDSDYPYMDFSVSMEEMVEAYGLYDWDCLEEMLVWYLKVNSKSAHGHIVGAFVDLLLSLISDHPQHDENDDEDVVESLEDCVGGKR